MPKRVNNIFYNKLKFKNMLLAYERAANGKYENKEVIAFEMDLACNITQILKQLYSGTYCVSGYREFRIYEPRRRVIQTLPFKDRVIQQWYVEEFIKPIFIPKFIEDTYAGINNRGVHKGVKKLNKYIYEYSKKNNDLYILKCDISGFFYSISKQKLFDIISRKVKDEKFLNLTRQLIYYNNEPVGIPIGNYSSQYFANIYLNELDHFVKEDLKIKYYVRYMDDFVLLAENREHAKVLLDSIKKYLDKKLGLQLNKKTNYFKMNQGVNFCGYKIYKDRILLSRENKKKIYIKVKKWNQLYDNKKINFKEVSMSLNSWIGHAQNADTCLLIKKVIKKCKWIYTDNCANDCNNPEY